MDIKCHLIFHPFSFVFFDIGAGAGRVSLYLQKKGFDVTAIDKSPLAIKVCKKRGVKKAKVLPIEKIDTFKSNTFDTVIMFGGNFGLFGSYKKAKILLKKSYIVVSIDILLMIIDGFVNGDIITMTGGFHEKQMDGVDV